MSLFALLVEGQTERIFFDYLLPHIQLQDQLFVRRRLDEILENTTHQNKIWLVDCQGDASIPTYINKNDSAFMRNDFDRIIMIRDYYPANRPPSNLCKPLLCQNIIDNIHDSILEKYQDNIFINLSVEEIEAWFFIDTQLFANVHYALTADFINSQLNNILLENPENIKRPAIKLQNIITLAIPEYKYDKHENDVHYLVSRINIDSCFEAMSPTYAESFNRIVNFLLAVL